MVAALGAAQPWAARIRDLPDPAGYADFIAYGEQTATRILERHRTGRFPVGVDLFPLPKHNGLRQMSWLDPYDDLALRVLVGRASAAIAEACASPALFGYRLATTGPGWSTVDHRRAGEARRELGLELLEREDCAALGTLDVANFYPTVDLDVLRLLLIDAGAPPGAVHRLVDSLEGLRLLGGATGLPIGFDGSGPLANLYLRAVDEIAAQVRVGFIRQTDDAWLFLSDESHWPDAVVEWEQELAALHLNSNQAKAHLHPKATADPRSVVVHGLLDSVTHGSSRRVPADEALEMLRDDLESKDPDDVVQRFCLGALRSHRDVRGFGVLTAHPELVGRHPKAAGDFLVSLARDHLAQAAVDRDWLVEQVVAPGGGAALAGKLQLCRVAAHLRLSRQAGKAFADIASGDGHKGLVPLRTWAAVAWAHSDDWKAGKAADAARYEGSLSVRRGYLLGFHRRSGNRTSDRAFRDLQRIEPDLGPTLAFAAAG